MRITATKARANLYGLIDQASTSHIPIHITGKKNTAVLISEEDWSAIQETLHLHTIEGLAESIQKGLNTPLDECDEDVKW